MLAGYRQLTPSASSTATPRHPDALVIIAPSTHRLSVSDSEEAQLLEQLRQGSEVAFRTVVERHQKRVYNTVLALVQSPEEAEDVTQEVFVEVFQTVNRFRGDAALTTWLYRIATSRALNAIQKRKAKKRFAFLTTLFGDDNEVQHHPPDFRHPGVVLEEQERIQYLFRAIDTLANQQKVAFTLRYREDLSYQEIAAVMETTVPAVESLLVRAKQALRKQLQPYYHA